MMLSGHGASTFQNAVPGPSHNAKAMGTPSDSVQIVFSLRGGNVTVGGAADNHGGHDAYHDAGGCGRLGGELSRSGFSG
jgi:hypothetical protein